MSIRFKILGSIFIILVLSFAALTVTVSNIVRMRRTADKLRIVQQHISRNIEEANKLIQESSKYACMSLITGRKELMDKAISLTKRATDSLKDLKNNTSDRQLIKEVSRISGMIEAYKKELSSASAVFGNVNLSASQSREFNQIMSQGDAISERLEKAKNSILQALDNQFAQQASSSKKITSFTIALMIINFIVGFAIALVLSNRISETSKKLSNGLKELAEGKGDLRFRFEKGSNDELGEATSWFNRFMDTLRDMITTVKDSVQAVQDSVTRVSSASEELSASLEETSQTTATLAATAEELERTAQELENTAQAVTENAEVNKQTAAKGYEYINTLTREISRVKEEFEAIASNIKELHSQAEAIKSIVSVINEIADQTNLLALNAAIEAARAGEHGRGFAVVADEVRKLAEKTTAQTRNIEDIIKGISSRIEGYVESVSRSSESILKVSQYAEETMRMLEEVKERSSDTRTRVEEIYQALQEQKIATSQVSQSLHEINIAVEEASKALIDITDSIKDVVKKVEELKGLTDGFTV